MALAWVRAHSGRNGLPVIIPIPGATTEDRVVENTEEIELSEDDLEDINKVLASTQVIGGRYDAGHARFLNA
jgi:pyridoxine 4-dehydrogenase